MNFKIIGRIDEIEAIAVENLIREIGRPRKMYGNARWRKLNRIATIQLPDETICKTEVHWYQAHGIEKREAKIKRILEMTQ